MLLLYGVVERVVDELVVPRGPDSGRDSDWEGALRRTAHAFRRVALTDPNVVPLLVTLSLSRPVGAVGPWARCGPSKRYWRCSSPPASTSHGALHAARLFTGFLYGHIQDELQERVHYLDATEDVLRLGLHRLPDHPVSPTPFCSPRF